MTDDHTSRLDAERLEAKLSQLSAGLESMDSEIDRLSQLATLGTAAGMIAHEVRGILTPVRAYAQMALKAPDDRELVEKALQHAEHGSASAVQISETILEIVSGIGGHDQGAHDPPATVEGVLVLDVANRAVELLQETLDRQQIRVAFEIDAQVAVAIGLVEFQQVLINLIDNAAHAMPDGGTLIVRSTCSTGNTAGRPEVMVEVEDSGPGIADSITDQAFEPFVSTGGADGGSVSTGLGLAVCKALVSHARGRISIGSSPSGGAQVRVMLPAA